TILSFNKTAERLLGCMAEEVYGTKVDRFFPKEELPKLFLAVDARIPWFGTTHLIHADGTGFPVELSSTKIVDEITGKEIATLLIAVDIRERNRLRKNLIQSQKMTFIGELVSGLAHQLNNPLVGVVNIAEVLMHAMERGDPRAEYVRMIKDAGEHCREVIARLLRFSRRHDTTTHVDVDVVAVMGASIELLSRHPRFGKIKVERDLGVVPCVRGDPVLLQQAFMNILMNSAEAVGDDGVIRVGCSLQNGTVPQVEVTIADNGRGIPEEHIPRIFEPFYSTKADDEGTGIGLSLAYWIVQDHGGRIDVESTPGKGTCFVVMLPAKE
ncbi:MAG TPA: ATP-binding protein, partial [Deltaproteobacteria bacterium]|nr:ATP-binding protein [Deltaproteobacteria bacterium]